ncbi:UNVERIFIED_CONTAM: Disease resistance protein RPP13 [Sesamum latifolium]|uniref:Disease resistance protein RPP13 n=1 Tax=Sesamum latifolium TaxID=2727402 RepID=A0AAW2UYM0_9LAMI
MAYNLEFLVQILEQFLDPDDHDQPLWILDPNKKPQIESLLQNARFLKDFLEGQSFTSFPPDLDLEEVIEDFDYAKEEMMAIVEGREMHPKYRLMRRQPNLDVFVIVGIPGIGKTTLARNLYDDPSVISHFDIRAWFTISPDYNVREILLGLLHCVTGKLTHELLEKKNEELGSYLWEHLGRRRYLIVLDDMWDIKPWDDLREYLGNHKNQSQIIVTTRSQYVSDYIGSNWVHQIQILKKMMNAGIFLSVSGLLSQADRRQVFWEQVAEDLSLIVAAEGEQYLDILSLVYNYLAYYLKPCFLYMSAFPEDYEIHASKLIKLWVAEGFLKPILGKSLEEAAEIYLKDLVDRNLVTIKQQRPQGNVKSYLIHAVLRDLCVRKAHEENFLFIKKRNIPGDVCSRRVCVHRIRDIDRPLNQMPLARSFLSIVDFPGEILQLINLRYLALSTSELPSSISRLWNLQILIFQAIAFSSCLHVVMPEILDMTQLRHIKFKGFYVWYDDKYREHFVVQDQLQSLSTIAVSGLTDRVLQTVPNLGKLGIFCNEELDHVKDLSHLHKLHTLNCRSPRYHTDNLLSNLIFPYSLKKLSLHDCGIRDLDMSRIGNLPNLQILKLRGCEFENRKWEPDEGEFCQLKFLIDWQPMISVSQDLSTVIRHCSHLNEIPPGIVDIPTLVEIEVHECNPSLVDSARMILEEQE